MTVPWMCFHACIKQVVSLPGGESVAGEKSEVTIEHFGPV